MRFFLLPLLLWQTACVSQNIVRDRAYEPATEAYQRGDVAAAIEKFPSGEKYGFIPTVEKSWLAIWQRQWNPEALQKQVATFDERRYTSLSREAGYFLFQESEEGYVPAEHEIAILHLISAIHFQQQEKNEDAEVELRRAGYVLDNYWDDASLRLWLGALWAGMGHWEEAQVDWRRAQAMNPSPELKKLLTSAPPQSLALHFFGNGPKTEWPEGQYAPDFKDEVLSPGDKLAISVSTLPWFKRHTQRNSELRDVLVKSNFMAQYLGSKTLTTAEHGLNKAGTIGIRAVGVAVGAAIVGGVIYLAAQAGGNVGSGDGLGYLLSGGVAAGYGIWKVGEDLDHKYTQVIREDDRKKQESLRIYRMVRFMPTWIALDTHTAEPNDYEIKVPINSPLSRTHLDLINHF